MNDMTRFSKHGIELRTLYMNKTSWITNNFIKLRFWFRRIFFFLIKIVTKFAQIIGKTSGYRKTAAVHFFVAHLSCVLTYEFWNFKKNFVPMRSSTVCVRHLPISELVAYLFIRLQTNSKSIRWLSNFRHLAYLFDKRIKYWLETITRVAIQSVQLLLLSTVIGWF